MFENRIHQLQNKQKPPFEQSERGFCFHKTKKGILVFLICIDELYDVANSLDVFRSIVVNLYFKFVFDSHDQVYDVQRSAPKSS